ncbi:MAG TPA: hypothetical protein VJP77_03475, partial [Planctomycetota bacterium]|nr:hypothetical protein [Planctomycetota bacterium]
SARLADGLVAAGKRRGVPLFVGRVGSLLCPYLSARPVERFADVLASDRARWPRFFHGLLDRGVLVPPSPFEAWFVSTAHDDATIDAVVDAADGALAAL